MENVNQPQAPGSTSSPIREYVRAEENTVSSQGENNPSQGKKKLPKTLVLLILAVFIGGIAVVLTQFSIKLPLPTPSPTGSPRTGLGGVKIETGVTQFTSEDDFRAYLEAAPVETGMGIGVMQQFAAPVAERSLDMAVGLGVGMVENESFKVAERVSSTNVQVAGIDEPDIVKTDGKQLYISKLFPQVYRGFEEPTRDDIEELMIAPVPPKRPEDQTRIITAFPPAELASLAGIDDGGDLLLADKMLVIFGQDKIVGFDVSDPAIPIESWDIDLEQNNYIQAAKLYNDTIYLVTRTQINRSAPCPFSPITVSGTKLSIGCAEIYHPITNVAVDVTYTVMTINPTSGEVTKNTSFVGSSGLSVVYMSTEAVYVTYGITIDFSQVFYDFFMKKGTDLISEATIERLKKLSEYDISSRAKMTELQIILEEYYNSLSDDERLRVENEITNRMSDYAKENMRNIEQTGIIKIGIDELNVASTGGIPGSPLNQFSLDEYQDHLRIATTVSGRMFGGESANDVYVLDGELNTVGSITDLGLTERIYSARFVGNKGYLVTFRQIDPFYVLDLSDPKNPVRKGELKIPGYSSYLHPVTVDLILGVGKEGSKVKLSLFEVSDPQNPTEVAKYMLDENWSEVLNTHHAFLLDDKFKVFFMPGSKGGYVFSYLNNGLELIRAVSDIQAQRAVFLDNYMYIVGRSKIVVLNEGDWLEVNNLTF